MQFAYLLPWLQRTLNSQGMPAGVVGWCNVMSGRDGNLEGKICLIHGR